MCVRLSSVSACASARQTLEILVVRDAVIEPRIVDRDLSAVPGQIEMPEESS
jgi:hypothetical protein